MTALSLGQKYRLVTGKNTYNLNIKILKKHHEHKTTLCV